MKKTPHRLFLLVFKIVESLQCILKTELLKNCLQDISFLVLKSIQTLKSCCEAIGPFLVTLF